MDHRSTRRPDTDLELAEWLNGPEPQDAAPTEHEVERRTFEQSLLQYWLLIGRRAPRRWAVK